MYGLRLAVVIFASLVLEFAWAEDAELFPGHPKQNVYFHPLGSSANTNPYRERWRQGRMLRKSGAALAIGVAALTALVLVLKCWQAIQSGFKSTGSGENRFLAVGGGDECGEEGPPSASGPLGLLQLSDEDLEGLTSLQKTLLGKALDHGTKIFQKQRDLEEQEERARQQMTLTAERYRELQEIDMESSEAVAARILAENMKEIHLTIKRDLEEANKTLASWGFGPHCHARVLVILARSHTAGRHVTCKAARALAVAELVTKTAPTKSTGVPPSHVRSVQALVTSRISSLNRNELALRNAQVLGPRREDLEKLMDVARSGLEDAIMLYAMLSTTGLEDLTMMVKEAVRGLERALVSATDISADDPSKRTGEDGAGDE